MIDVSIVVAVYNQESYIKQALDSILMQKVNFEYEVLIGEDCSTDNSRNILKELELRLPSNFHIFYREKNYGALDNFLDLYHKTNGRYFIVLEADDFWTYDLKLQKQFDFLEKHPDYISVAHNTQVVDKNGNPVSYNYPECKREDYSFDDFLKGILPGQTTTKLTRNYYKYHVINGPNLDVGEYPGDQREAFLLCVNAKVRCIQEKWSAYRMVIKGGSSYTATCRYNEEQELYYWKQLYVYLLKYYPEDAYKIQQIGNRFIWRYFVAKIKRRPFAKKYRSYLHIENIPSRKSLYIFILLHLINIPFFKAERIIKNTRLQRIFGKV
jgi:glycosyltransferase involved in cell wall biosynthesis